MDEIETDLRGKEDLVLDFLRWHLEPESQDRKPSSEILQHDLFKEAKTQVDLLRSTGKLSIKSNLENLFFLDCPGGSRLVAAYESDGQTR